MSLCDFPALGLSFPVCKLKIVDRQVPKVCPFHCDMPGVPCETLTYTLSRGLGLRLCPGQCHLRP